MNSQTRNTQEGFKRLSMMLIELSAVAAFVALPFISAAQTAGAIQSFTINDVGQNYQTGDILTVVQGSGSNGSIKVTGTSGDAAGPATSVDLLSAGHGYSTGVADTVGGSGSGATISITVLANANGQVSTINNTPASGGTGYKAGDVLTLTQGDGADATVIVNSVSSSGSGTITGVVLNGAGSGYATGDANVSGGHGSGASITIYSVSSTGGSTDQAGAITALSSTFITPGTGYTTNEVIQITGGGGSGATALVTAVDNSGGVTGVQLQNHGSGYATGYATVNGPSGSGASVYIISISNGNIQGGGGGGTVETNVPYVPLVQLPGTTDANGNATAASYIPGLFSLGIGIASGLAVLVIAFNGIRYMMSDVVTSKSAAKDGIKNALFGLLLAIASWLILHTINPQLVNFTF